MKKYIRIIGVVLVAAVVFVGGIFVGYNVERKLSQEKKMMMLFELGDNFEDNQESFLIVAQKALAFFDEIKTQNSQVRYINVKPGEDDRWDIFVVLPDKSYYNEYRDMSESEKKACAAVTKAWEGRGGSFHAKVADNNQVDFAASDYYIVSYTENDEQPNLPDLWTQEITYIERLAPHWHQFVLMEQFGIRF